MINDAVSTNEFFHFRRFSRYKKACGDFCATCVGRIEEIEKICTSDWDDLVDKNMLTLNFQLYMIQVVRLYQEIENLHIWLSKSLS